MRYVKLCFISSYVRSIGRCRRETPVIESSPKVIIFEKKCDSQRWWSSKHERRKSTERNGVSLSLTLLCVGLSMFLQRPSSNQTLRDILLPQSTTKRWRIPVFIQLICSIRPLNHFHVVHIDVAYSIQGSNSRRSTGHKTVISDRYVFTTRRERVKE